MLGLRFCARAFSSCGEWGPLFIAVRRPLTIATSLVAEHSLLTRRLSSCGSRAQLLRGMWDLPRPGLEPVSPALAGRLPTTAPAGKPCLKVLRGRGTRITFQLFLWWQSLQKYFSIPAWRANSTPSKWHFYLNNSGSVVRIVCGLLQKRLGKK